MSPPTGSGPQADLVEIDDPEEQLRWLRYGPSPDCQGLGTISDLGLGVAAAVDMRVVYPMIAPEDGPTRGRPRRRLPARIAGSRPP